MPDNIPDLVIASSTTITMAASYLGKDTRITIGGQQFKYASLTTLNFAVSGFNGLVASTAASTTGPSGFTSWKQVGVARTAAGGATLAFLMNVFGGSFGVNKYQRKQLASNLSSDGPISDWTFNNLIVGKVYQLDISSRMVHSSSADNLKQGVITITHTGSTLYGPYWNLLAMQTGDQYPQSTSVFVATATSITMSWNATNLQLWAPAYASLTELNSVAPLNSF